MSGFGGFDDNNVYSQSNTYPETQQTKEQQQEDGGFGKPYADEVKQQEKEACCKRFWCDFLFQLNIMYL
jgi:hypothetical protein